MTKPLNNNNNFISIALLSYVQGAYLTSSSVADMRLQNVTRTQDTGDHEEKSSDLKFRWTAA